MSLLENVKELVSQRKMTVAELERKLDFSQGSIRHWDKTYPGVDKVQKVAEYFDVSTDYLLGRSDVPKWANNDDIIIFDQALKRNSVIMSYDGIELSEEDKLKLEGMIKAMLWDKIQENNQMQMRFLSDVSHELRTPIAVIKGHMDLLQRWGKNDPEILEESLEAASHEANRMTIMINDMLDSIRVKGSFENHRNDTCDLNSSIRTVIGNFRVLHDDYQFYLNDSEGSDRPAQIYSQHFEQVITILIDNAVKYSPVNKEIQVTIKALEDEMLVQVQDNGEGISKEDIEHIFERFYRSDKARNRTTTQSGVGIGLSILYQIVEAYRCHIDVSSELGVGPRFDLYIPFAESETTTPQIEG